jgi:hypothetical protein
VADGLVKGKTYRFVYAANNYYGDSEYSLHLIAGVGAPSVLAAGPSRDGDYDLFDDESGTVQMMLKWAPPATPTLSVLGYALEMDDGLGNDDKFTKVYDSGNNPLGREYLATGLSQNLDYRFRVQVRDINGLRGYSPITSFKSCVKPGRISAPILLSVSTTGFGISWLQPINDGGCSLTKFSLYMSENQDAVSPTYSELIAVIDATTLKATHTFADASKAGKILRLKI